MTNFRTKRVHSSSPGKCFKNRRKSTKIGHQQDSQNQLRFHIICQRGIGFSFNELHYLEKIDFIYKYNIHFTFTSMTIHLLEDPHHVDHSVSTLMSEMSILILNKSNPSTLGTRHEVTLIKSMVSVDITYVDIMTLSV